MTTADDQPQSAQDGPPESGVLGGLGAIVAALGVDALRFLGGRELCQLEATCTLFGDEDERGRSLCERAARLRLKVDEGKGRARVSWQRPRRQGRVTHIVSWKRVLNADDALAKFELPGADALEAIKCSLQMKDLVREGREDLARRMEGRPATDALQVSLDMLEEAREEERAFILEEHEEARQDADGHGSDGDATP